MAVPKRRHSRSRTRKRRSHDGLTAPVISRCATCNEPKEHHRLCGNCGTYRGREVFSLETSVE